MWGSDSRSASGAARRSLGRTAYKAANLKLEELRTRRHDLGCIQDDLDVRPAPLTLSP